MLRGTTLVAGQCPAALRRQPKTRTSGRWAPRCGETASGLPKDGEQPDRITVSIPAQPTLPQIQSQYGSDADSSACCSKASAHSLPALFSTQGNLRTGRRAGASQSTALCGAARDVRSFSSHLQIVIKCHAPERAGRQARLPAAQGFYLLYPKQARFVKTCFSKHARKHA